jgi:hypothetical protein
MSVTMSIAEDISGGLATPLVAGPGVVGGAIVKAITNLTATLTAEGPCVSPLMVAMRCRTVAMRCLVVAMSLRLTIIPW